MTWLRDNNTHLNGDKKEGVLEVKKNCNNCKHGRWDSDDSVNLYFDCEKRDPGEDMKLENNLGRKEYRERAKVCCELKSVSEVAIDLVCPTCSTGFTGWPSENGSDCFDCYSAKEFAKLDAKT